MNKEFISYEQALDLKELGFDEPCVAFYNGERDLKRYMNGDKDWNMLEEQTLINSKITFPNSFAAAPLKQQVIRWFRDVHMIKGYVSHAQSMGGYKITMWRWNFDNNIGEWEGISPLGTFTTYEEAESVCIDKLIELVKNAQN